MTKNLNDTLKEKLDEIAEYNLSHSTNNTHLGGLVGNAGIALFQSYYAQFTSNERYLESTEEILNHCFDQINEGYSVLPYCTGLAGLGWTINHLVKKEFIEEEYITIFSDLDETLYQAMCWEMEENDHHYDFLHGALGYGFYFLERMNDTQDHSEKATYKTYLLHLIDLLKISMIALKSGGGFWKSIIDLETRAPVFMFGLSHGSASIISFLLRASQNEDLATSAKPLLIQAIDGIMGFCNHAGKYFFPLSLDTEEIDAMVIGKECRLAWCHGDLGIAMTLWQAAQILDRNDIQQLALKIFDGASKRRRGAESGVMDVGLCHGSFGIAQLFGRIYKLSGLARFKQLSEFWLSDGLQRGQFEDGIAGFKEWYAPEKKFQNSNELLVGTSGIGLAMMDYLNDYQLSWDNCMLLS